MEIRWDVSRYQEGPEDCKHKYRLDTNRSLRACSGTGLKPHYPHPQLTFDDYTADRVGRRKLLGRNAANLPGSRAAWTQLFLRAYNPD